MMIGHAYHIDEGVTRNAPASLCMKTVGEYDDSADSSSYIDIYIIRLVYIVYIYASFIAVRITSNAWGKSYISTT